jgi:hypothetical protein
LPINVNSNNNQWKIYLFYFLSDCLLYI